MGDLILFLFYGIAVAHYIYRYFHPFDEGIKWGGHGRCLTMIQIYIYVL